MNGKGLHYISVDLTAVPGLWIEGLAADLVSELEALLRKHAEFLRRHGA